MIHPERRRENLKKIEEMDKLKPCPFCGSEAMIQFLMNDKHEKTPACWIVCTNARECGVHTYTMNNEEEAADVWNRRTGGEM